MPKHIPKPKVLVVEDEDVVRESFAELLSATYRPMAVASAEEALALLDRHSFDAALVDLSLPRMSGVELLDEFRIRRLRTPVIVVTGAKDMETALSCISKGAFHYLTKPYRVEELMGTLAGATELAELRRRDQVFSNWLDQTKGTVEVTPKAKWKGLKEEAQALVAGFLAHEAPEGKRFAALVKAVERELVLKALSLNRWNQEHAAKWLGINVITLNRRMAYHNIPGVKRPIGLQPARLAKAGSDQR